MAPAKLVLRRHSRKMCRHRNSTPTHQSSSRGAIRKSAPGSGSPVAHTLHSNGTPKPTDGGDDDAQKRESTPATPAFRTEERESVKASTREPDAREPTPSQQDRGNTPARSTPGPSTHASSVPPRPDNRSVSYQNQPLNRPSHALPIRPDSQPHRSRPSDRQSEYGAPHSRHDSRLPPSDYGRLDRPIDPYERALPGGRTPERGSGPGPADRRDYGRAESRDYDDRAMRAPPRDARGPPIRGPPQWQPREPRDNREARDDRERLDHRGNPGAAAMEPRRAPSNSNLSQDYSSHQRDLPPSRHQGPDRQDAPPARPPPTNQTTPTDGPAINPARAALIDPPVNPARAALINETGPPRHESPRSDRDGRRERSSRPQSPRRGEDRRGNEPREDRRGEERGPLPQHIRNEAPRDHRDERMPIQGPPSSRDRREEISVNSMPMGPRGPRSETQRAEITSTSRGSREMFQPTQSSRQSNNQAQDPNYGRLNAPSEPAPSGPRSEYLCRYNMVCTNTSRRSSRVTTSATTSECAFRPSSSESNPCRCSSQSTTSKLRR